MLQSRLTNDSADMNSRPLYASEERNDFNFPGHDGHATSRNVT